MYADEKLIRAEMQRLEALGDAAVIARELEYKGVKAECGNPFQCALARYFAGFAKKAFDDHWPRVPIVTYDVEDSEVCGNMTFRSMPAMSNVSVALGPNLTAFLHAFDEGLFQNLLTDDERTPVVEPITSKKKKG